MYGDPLNPSLADSDSRTHPTCGLPGLSTGNDTAPSSERWGSCPLTAVWGSQCTSWSGGSCGQDSGFSGQCVPTCQYSLHSEASVGNRGQGPSSYSAGCLSTQHPHHGQSALCPPGACPAPFPGENRILGGKRFLFLPLLALLHQA